MKKIITLILTITISSIIIGITSQAEEKAIPLKQSARPSFGMILGSISKIDTKDPARPVLEVKSDIDNKVHTIELTPWTNVSKVTDVSELKPGDAVRVMTRKVDDKETAITILFGKIKNIPTPIPATQEKAPAQTGPAPIKRR